MSALPATFWTATARPFLNPDDMIDTAGQIVALREQFACLRDVPPVTECWSAPPHRLVELLAKPSPLSAAEWAELTAFERDAA